MKIKSNAFFWRLRAQACALLFVSAAIIGAGLPQNAAAALPAAQKTALQNLYTSTGGASWTNSTNWGVGDPCENTWHGVECDATNTMLHRLLLSDNKLSGALNADFVALVDLTHIELQQNSLTGSLPVLSSMPNLVSVNFSSNQFSGSIPALTSLAFLEQFYVNNNQLTGALPSLAGLSNLSIVVAYVNRLSGAIPAFSNVPKLSLFNVGYNQLSGAFPQSIVNATSLTNVSIESNELTGSLPDLTLLTLLRTFTVNDNRITGVGSIAGLQNLVEFDVGGNEIVGTAPALTNLPELSILNISTNAFSGALPSIAGAPKLTRVYANNNGFQGALPSISGAQKLVFFDASDNTMSGVLPSFSDLPVLEELKLGRNQFTGGFPSLSAPQLRYLDLARNQLTGAVPSLAGFTQLTAISLEYNQFSGTVPMAAPNFESGQSGVCPNDFTPASTPASANDLVWNAATRQTPWSVNCNLRYSVTLSAIGNGTITANAAGPYVPLAQPTFTVTPASGYIAEVTSTCGGALTGNSYVVSQLNANCLVTATFRIEPTAGCNLDIDGDDKFNAMTDGVLIVRYLLGLTGSTLTNGAVNANGRQVIAEDIEAAIDSMRTNGALDLNGDSSTDAATDGVMLLRALLGFTGSAITNNALGETPRTRSTWTEIRSHLTSRCAMTGLSQ